MKVEHLDNIYPNGFVFKQQIDAFSHDRGLEYVTRGNVLLGRALFPKKKEVDLILPTEGIGRFHEGEEIGWSFQVEHVCPFDPKEGHSLLWFSFNLAFGLRR